MFIGVNLNVLNRLASFFYNQMVKRADDIEINRSGPVFVFHGCEYIKFGLVVIHFLSNNTQVGYEMFILRCFGYPIMILFGFSDAKERDVVARCKRNIFWRQ